MTATSLEALITGAALLGTSEGANISVMFAATNQVRQGTLPGFALKCRSRLA